MNNLFKLAAVAATSAVLATASHAAVVSTVGGLVAGSSAGLDLDVGVTQNDLLQAFDENQGVDATVPVLVDYLVGANFNVGDTATGIMSQSAGGAQTLAPGSYDSHLIHWDPEATGTNQTSAQFTFSGRIVAIIVSNAGSVSLLEDSDSIFGNAAGYQADISRRSETFDTFTLTSGKVLDVDMIRTLEANVDNIRVITTAVVPLPASVPLLLTALGGMALVRRRKS